MRRRGVIPPILLVGLGKMGGAMLAGWREHGLSPSYAVDPSRPESPGPEVTVVASAPDLPADFTPAAIVLAVKPQNAPETLPLYAHHQRAVMLSIMAGRNIASLKAGLDGAAIVRAMPNTPAAIRQGITVACADPDVTADQRDLCHTLLAGVGLVEWVDDESLIDPVTAVSGGGPAYVFLLAELLEQAAIEQGIPPALARTLARQTVSGSGALLAASDLDAAQLRRNVTSPKGTTERALAVLMDEAAWPRAVSQAIAAATARSRELGG
jgi:pyrroline-5-carboxylate reductase